MTSLLPTDSGASARSMAALDRLHAAARAQGFVCQATEWHGVGAKYRFACAQGHRFERAAYGVVYKTVGCEACRRDKTRAKFDRIVAQRSGECLDGGYLGSKVRHRTRCQARHEWNPEGGSVLAGYWCPHCAGVPSRSALKGRKIRYGLANLEAKAAEHGGRCLATAYGKGYDHYPFECAAGHRWEATAYKILEGQWCRQCVDARLAANRADADGLRRIQERARDRGGDCLSESYLGTSARYRFRCAAGHEWEALGNNLLQAGWCRRCHNEQLKLGIDAMRELARARGGRCLSETYVHGKAKLTWECHRGHVWEATPGGRQVWPLVPTMRQPGDHPGDHLGQESLETSALPSNR